MIKALKIIAFNLFFLLIFLEAGSFLYFKSGMAVSNYLPSYINGASKTEPQWMTEYEDWGAWHLPNDAAHLQSRCISTDLISNSYGARDKERSKRSEVSRVAVLGDSFVEGYGVPADARFTDLLEKKLSTEFMNFGASGNFGPVQYYVLYRDLVSQFDHDSVLIAFLPDNDFTDNDPEVWAKQLGYRYRPYYKKTAEGFDLFYGAPKPDHVKTFEEMMKDGNSELSFAKKLQRMTWLNGVYRELRYYQKVLSYKVTQTYSGYYDASDEQYEAAFSFIKKIKELAQDKRVMLFTIPRLVDLQRLKTEESPLIAKFEEFSAKNGIEYLDLAQPIYASGEKIEELFIPCDGHWNDHGHAVMSDILQQNFFQK